MKMGMKGTVLIALSCTACLLTSTARAGHATTYLDAITFEVTNRVVVESNTLATAERKALTKAGKALQRNTKTQSADLNALAAASTALRKDFGDDTLLNDLQTGAIDTFSFEARADLDATIGVIGTNVLTKAQSNQLFKAVAALNTAEAQTNLARRARLTGAAINKLNATKKKITRGATAPFTLLPPIAGWPGNPDQEVDVIDLTETAPSESETTRFYFKAKFPQPDPYLYFTADNPEEVGLWTYERTGPNTGVIHLTVTLADPFPPFDHGLTLTFETPRSGTFTGVNGANENITGRFVVH